MLPSHLSSFSRIYLINARLDGAGFGAMLLQTINQIRYCERMGYLPVVKYDASCRSHFRDPQRGHNVWEQYFEPLRSDVAFADVERWCADPHSPLEPQDLLTLPDDEMIHICEHDPDSAYTFTFANWRMQMPSDLPAWYSEQRSKGADIVGRYFRVKSAIQSKVTSFTDQHFSGHAVLGLHIRGTDLMYAPPMSPGEYFPAVDRWLAERHDGRVFVATDQAQYLESFQARYGEAILCSDSWRSRDDVAPFNKEELSPHKRGEDVLVDILLLSACDFLLKGASNVGEMAMYFNPELRCEDLSLGKRWAFGQDYGEKWNGPLPEQTAPAWRLMKGRRLDVMPDDARSQSRWQRWRYRIRPWWTWLPKLFRRGLRFLRRWTHLGSGQFS